MTHTEHPSGVTLNTENIGSHLEYPATLISVIRFYLSHLDRIAGVVSSQEVYLVFEKSTRKNSKTSG